MSAFPAAEYQSRIAACQAEMQLRGLDALLIFAQESQYYLFGYDGGGYVFFQCTLLTATSATPTLLCRRPDVAQARDTSMIDDIRIWFDAEDANPALQLRDILLEKGLRGAVIGVELETYGLTAGNWENLRQTLAADVTLHDASSLVRTLRLIKSPGEISLIRRAAELADKAIEAAADKAEPGVLDAALATVMCRRPVRWSTPASGRFMGAALVARACWRNMTRSSLNWRPAFGAIIAVLNGPSSLVRPVPLNTACLRLSARP